MEDLRLYGTRPEPPEAVEVDEATQIANAPLKRNPIQFHAAVDRPSKARDNGSDQNFNWATVTALDRNSGASPMDAWLNQSAVPSAVLAAEVHSRDPVKLEDILVAEEVREIEYFRNVHITTALEPTPPEIDVSAQNGLDVLGFEAQIYYRNITDRYPLLPTYLACRLATANHDRAERLRRKIEGQAKLRVGEMACEYKPFDSGPQFPNSLTATVSDDTPAFAKQPSPSTYKQVNSADLSISGSYPPAAAPCVDGVEQSHKFIRLQKASCTSANNNPKRATLSSQQPSITEIRLLSSTQRKHRCTICDKRFTRPSSLQTHMHSHTGEKPYACDAKGCGRHFTVVSNLRRHRKVHEGDRVPDKEPLTWAPSSPNTPSNPTYPNHDAYELSQLHVPCSNPDLGVWSHEQPDADADDSSSRSSFYASGTEAYRVQSRGQRRASVDSCSSSRNSSLHGYPEHDPREQDPVFLDSDDRVFSDYGHTPPGLPPPPVDLSKRALFGCDICGDLIQADRRKEWQYVH